MKKFVNFILITFILMGTVFAIIPEKIRTNLLILGTGTAIDHTIEMDTGDGAANEKIILNGTTKAFSLSDALNVQGNIQADGSMTLGDGTAVDRIMTVDRGGSNPFLKWDETQGVWTFSNDGTLTKKIGSGGGSGSGINLLQNGSAEDGLLNWTASTPAQWTELTATADLLEGEKTFRLDFAAQNDNLVSDAVEIIGGLYGQNCEASINYTGLPADLVKFRITDGDGDEIAVSDLLSDATLSTQKTIYFRCPLSGATANDRTLKLQVIQTEVGNAGVMDFDLAYWGTMRNLSETVINGRWINDGVSILSATTTAPTKPNSMITDTVRYRIVGDSAEIEMILDWNASTGAAVGSGDMLFKMPNNLKIDGTKLAFYTTLESGPQAWTTTNLVGTGVFMSGAVSYNSRVIAYNEDFVRLFLSDDTASSNGSVSSSHAAITTANSGYILRFTVPIQNQVGITQTIFNSIPTVAENVNALNYRVDGTTASPHTIISSDVSGVIITSTVTGRFVLNYTNLNLVVIPAIDCEAEAPNQNFYCNVVSTSVGLTSTEVEVRISSTGALTDQIFNFAIRKQGNDFRLPSVQPIIINQVSTKHDEGIQTQSCHITNTGTPTIAPAEGMCEIWVDSLVDGGVGIVTYNFVSGTWKNIPVCTCTAGGNRIGGIYTAGTLTTVGCRTAVGSSNAGIDIDQYLTCTARR